MIVNIKIIALMSLFNFALIAQHNSINGKVVDKQTGKPIANANIFLAYTFRGTTTNSQGEYSLKGIPPANYTLVISHIQYNKIQEKVLITPNKVLRLDFKLEPRVYQLPDVVVNEDEDDWQDYFDIFKEQLLGMTDNAEQCEILNPYNIDFYDVDGPGFQAFCKDPIYIKNGALGYRITYILDYFWTDEFSVKYSGIPYFQELSAPNDSVKQTWIENRAAAYNGSLRDFIAETADRYTHDSWLEKSLSFSVASKPEWIKDAKKFIYTSNLNEAMASGDNEYEIKYCFQSPVIVEYLPHKKVTNNYEDISKFELTKDTVTADILGRTYDTFGIHILSGKWSKERLADTLPFEYSLPEKK